VLQGGDGRASKRGRERAESQALSEGSEDHSQSLPTEMNLQGPRRVGWKMVQKKCRDLTGNLLFPSRNAELLYASMDERGGSEG
jgi:hypothetical protein